MKKKIELTKEQAEEMYYSINSYFLFIRCAEMIDKTTFSRLKFWSPVMNNHLRKASQSIEQLMLEFNRHFKAKEHDVVNYDAPSELFDAMEFLSRKSPEQINEILNKLKNDDK